MKKLLLGLLAVFLLCVPAVAATANLQPLYDLGNEFLKAIMEGLTLAVSGWVMFIFHKYLTPLIGAQLEAKARDSLNTALANGAAIAMSKVVGAEQLHQNIDIKGQIGAWAAQYAIDHAPGAVKRFGLDPDQLALKALAYIPAPPVFQDLTSATAPKPAPVTTEPLPPI